ncbi:hypothetical protein IMPR6_140017 [Imperialibacter sp. EC-SDR9]|nr:hypothetical protein IMPERIA89_130017 [Imperialibacter sp. 89]VVT03150.1 hypothetical protein IMPR6_140017 [Imperialibacter sp. EC-SDR9]
MQPTPTGGHLPFNKNSKTDYEKDYDFSSGCAGSFSTMCLFSGLWHSLKERRHRIW